MISDKTLLKIKSKQKHITTSENLRTYSYHHDGGYKPTGIQKWALDDYSKQKFRKYYLKNKEELKKKKREYFKTEKGKQVKKKSDAKYYKKNKKILLEKGRKYTEMHSEENRKRVSEWQKTHSEQRNANHRRWHKRHPEKVKENFNRRRNMGFVPLNEPIEGVECIAHHVDKNHILYIPKEIHKQFNKHKNLSE